MTNIILKSSSVAGEVPLLSDLGRGIVAINHADGKLYFEYDSNTGPRVTSVCTVDSLNQSTVMAMGGAVPSSLQNKFGEALSVRDFGAKCDGVTDDSYAVTQALNSGLPIFFPAGITICASPVVVTNAAVTIRGAKGRSFIQFTGPGNGITITNSQYTQVVNIDDVCIVTTQQEPGVGLTISYAQLTNNDILTYGEYSFGRIVGCEVRGVDFGTSGWATGIHVIDVCNFYIFGNLIIGRRDLTTSAQSGFLKMTTGLQITGDGGRIISTGNAGGGPIDVTTVHVMQNKVYSGIVGMLDEGYIEGIEYINNVVVGFQTCYLTNRNGLRPLVRYQGNHANAFQTGISVTNAPQSWVVDNLIYKNELATGTTQAIMLASCAQSVIRGNRGQNECSDANISGGWNLIKLAGSPYSYIESNWCERGSTLIYITAGVSGTTGVYSRDNTMEGVYQNAIIAEYVDDSGGNNYRTDGPVVLYNGLNTAAISTTQGQSIGLAYTITNAQVGQNYQISAGLSHTQGGTAGKVGMYAIQVAGNGGATFGPSTNSLTATAASDQIIVGFNGIITVTTRGAIGIGLIVQNSMQTGGTIPVSGLQFTVTLL